jgi:hypothetical protein
MLEVIKIRITKCLTHPEKEQLSDGVLSSDTVVHSNSQYHPRT